MVHNTQAFIEWKKGEHDKIHTLICVSLGVLAKKGGCPTNISYSITPTLHQSQLLV